ncbi:MAG: FumA C-terminus/TtdB family hydratase beta subunit [Candidatus Methylomirabilales bacterium]
MTEDPAPRRLQTPLSPEEVQRLAVGDPVLLDGVIYAARDAAHARLVQGLQGREEPPIPLEGQVIFFVGPTPARPGQVIGSIGPTTASRMDCYSPVLIARGLRGMIGKGKRAPEVREAMRRHGCVYFGAVEGNAALLARQVRAAEVVAYPDLGPEAIYRFLVEAFPVIVVNDVAGRDLYEEGRARYAQAVDEGAGTG